MGNEVVVDATTAANCTASELMVTMAARALSDKERVLVGVGQPNLAANLAKRTHAPNLTMIYEAGVIGAQPTRLPLSVGDPCLVSGALSIHPMLEVFTLFLQGGLVDVGFLGAAQIDRYGNLNSTVVGEYSRPKVKLAGSGGACDIGLLAGRVIVMLPHSRRRFPEQVDFITTPGSRFHGRRREEITAPGKGQQTVITNIGVLSPNQEGELILTGIHQGRAVQNALDQTGWDLKVADDLSVLEPPTDRELAVLRALDSSRIYLGKSEP